MIPRALRSVISDSVAFAILWCAGLLARMARGYVRRDGILAWAGPLILIAQLTIWLILYLLSFGLLLYGTGNEDFGAAMREAGSSLFTLGFAAVNTEEQTLLDFVAAATGPIVIAMMIGFLPTVYASYIEREVNVTRLSAVGGEPAWGAEYLVRHFLTERIDELPADFVTWAEWASRLRMTHITYPVLIWVRSARATRHYAVALLTVLDGAALHIALTGHAGRREASRLILEAGQTCEVLHLAMHTKPRFRPKLPFVGRFDDMTSTMASEARALPSWNAGMTAVHIAADQDIVRGFDAPAVEILSKGDSEPLRIQREEFDHAYDYLKRSGYPITVSPDDAWNQFQVERSRYEFPALELCRMLDATPAPWSGIRKIPTPTIWPTLSGDLLPELENDDES